MKIVVALGGNSLIRYGQKGTYGEQLENMRVTCRQLARMIKAGHDLVITHGNGPQVGNILLQQEATDEVPKMPLDVCGAMTQGEIGYLIQSVLRGELESAGTKKEVITIVTQVIVDKDSSAFKNPTKPIGPFYKEKSEGMVYVTKKGWRRVVASPKPIEVVEKDIIKKLVSGGFVVVAGGGGGIPVIKSDGRLSGVEAVVDKDFCAALIAESVGADIFMILTDVDGVAINFGKPDEKKLDRMSIAEAQKYIDEGQFGEGRMKPKIEACIGFLKKGGKKCIVSLPETALEAVGGKAGTEIFK